jgi:CheY-like chemotaxis protein
MTRTLVMDDDAVLRGSVCAVLEHAGYEVVAAADRADGLRQSLAAPAAVVMTDLEMPVMDGLQLNTARRHTAPTATVLAISGHPRAPRHHTSAARASWLERTEYSGLYRT